MPRFETRETAGMELAEQLEFLRGTPNLLILALPRGGVPVAAVVAQSLHAPLDLLMIRKLGYPLNPEFAVGAIGIDKHPILNTALPPLNQETLDTIIDEEYEELLRRNALYRQGRPPPEIAGKTLVVVDDGIATGATLKAALHSLKSQKPAKVVVAIPVAPTDVLTEIKSSCDDIVCLHQPVNFQAVGLWYENFGQVSDKEVIRLLQNQS